MKRMSQRALLLLSACLLACLVCNTFDAAAQDKKTDKKVDEKKVEEKKKDDKKVEEKKKDDKKPDDKKKEEKKTDKDKKEEKKVEEKKPEPFKPDPATVEIPAHKDWINVIALSADGKTLVTASRDRTVKVWSVADKKDVQTLKGHTDNVKGMLLVGDKIYASNGKWSKEKKAWEGEIKVWDAKAGKEIKTFKGHGEALQWLAASKDGKLIASASEDKTVIVREADTGKETATLKGHGATIHAVAFSPDGKKLATACADGSVKLWDAAGKELATFKVETTVEKVEPKGKDPKGKVTTVKEPGRDFTAVVFSNDSKRLFAASLDGLVKIYDTEANKEAQEIKAGEGIWAVALSPDGTKLATGGWDQSIKIWDATTGKELQTIKAHLGTVTALVFTPGGAQVVSAGNDGMVKIWDLKK
jgi:WD40 repeat protein